MTPELDARDTYFGHLVLDHVDKNGLNGTWSSLNISDHSVNVHGKDPLGSQHMHVLLAWARSMGKTLIEVDPDIRPGSVHIKAVGVIGESEPDVRRLTVVCVLHGAEAGRVRNAVRRPEPPPLRFDTATLERLTQQQTTEEVA